MKLNIKFLKFALVACVLIFASLARSQLCEVVPSYMACVEAGASKDVTPPSGTCQKITNRHSSNQALMVPFRSIPEWDSLNRTPPAGVSLSACTGPPPPPFCPAAMDPTDTTNTCIYQIPWGTGGFACSSVGRTHSACGGGNLLVDTVVSRTFGGFCQAFGCTWWACNATRTSTFDPISCP